MSIDATPPARARDYYVRMDARLLQNTTLAAIIADHYQEINWPTPEQWNMVDSLRATLVERLGEDKAQELLEAAK